MDGTLYYSKQMRLIMFRKLLLYYLLRPWRLYDLYILYVFRKMRDSNEFANSKHKSIEQEQYIQVANKLNVSEERIHKVIDKWIFTDSLKILYSCRDVELVEFIKSMPTSRWTIYSDYPSDDKLKALGLPANKTYSSTDAEINHMKPNPEGLLYILKRHGIDKSDCLFVGDRADRDGECARRCGVDYLILPKDHAARQKIIRDFILTQKDF